jgi:hypothetical protein
MSLGRKANRDHRVFKVSKAQRATPETLERKARLGLTAHRDNRVFKEFRVRRVSKEFRDPQELDLGTPFGSLQQVNPQPRMDRRCTGEVWP